MFFGLIKLKQLLSSWFREIYFGKQNLISIYKKGSVHNLMTPWAKASQLGNPILVCPSISCIFYHDIFYPLNERQYTVLQIQVEKTKIIYVLWTIWNDDESDISNRFDAYMLGQLALVGLAFILIFLFWSDLKYSPISSRQQSIIMWKKSDLIPFARVIIIKKVRA